MGNRWFKKVTWFLGDPLLGMAEYVDVAHAYTLEAGVLPRWALQEKGRNSDDTFSGDTQGANTDPSSNHLPPSLPFTFDARVATAVPGCSHWPTAASIPTAATPIPTGVALPAAANTVHPALGCYQRCLEPKDYQLIKKERKEGEKNYALFSLGRILKVNCGMKVAGGDGTVGWVLGCLGELHERGQEPVPFGTGNDLSRSFGWGGSFSINWKAAIKRILDRAIHAPIGRLDRYVLFDLAYCIGSGMDAQVAYGFHQLRNEKPYLAQGRIANKHIMVNCSNLKSLNLYALSSNPITDNVKRYIDIAGFGGVIDSGYLVGME
ncbi:hypothetical protein E3N88_14694 [Mikania micrantha]|uniref:diacylglycerol kinase (ATP) n=1 Tax=Mikania micrantha TaxID=192012 RepID=A0A5N6P258_9ASTR|nr:hypothetical protein E3N88_14694 [Mikania micrantha]